MPVGFYDGKVNNVLLRNPIYYLTNFVLDVLLWFYSGKHKWRTNMVAKGKKKALARLWGAYISDDPYKSLWHEVRILNEEGWNYNDLHDFLDVIHDMAGARRLSEFERDIGQVKQLLTTKTD